MSMDLLRAESGMGRWTCRVHPPRVNMLRCMQLRQPDAVLWANAWCHLMHSCIQQRHLLPVLAVDLLGRLAVEHPVNHAYGCALDYSSTPFVTTVAGSLDQQVIIP